MVRNGLKRTMVAALVGLAGLGMTVLPSTTASADTNEEVIVVSYGSTNPVNAVLQVGGTIVNQYTIINGVDAIVTTTEAGVLASMPGIVVTQDISVAVQSTAVSTGPHTPSDAFLGQTGATQLASGGNTGRGVTVAVLDTGIDNLPDFSGRLVGGVDLSAENNPYQDSFGHGTFVAGLIAGNGASSNGQYSGEAPGANLVSVKVAGANGSAKLGTLISGLQWTLNNQATYNIRVVNISLGFQPTGSTVTNPLDNAVEKVWTSGIAVVVSAGNAGPFNGTILSPGDDPLAITVGSIDDMAQSTVANDEMTDFSSVGPTSTDGWVKPDLVTSGRSVVSLAAPGSTVYNNHPSSVIGSGNFVGSGTSFSAAITSGAAALVLAANPGDTPNQLKAALLGTTNAGPVGNPFADGHGALNAYAAATTTGLNYNQSASGLVATQNGATVSLSPVGNPVDTWNGSAWQGSAWQGSAWQGSAWQGSAWQGSAWQGFTGSAWQGSAWQGSAWQGSAWQGSAWQGSAWQGSAWQGSAWQGSAWQGSAWN